MDWIHINNTIGQLAKPEWGLRTEQKYININFLTVV